MLKKLHFEDIGPAPEPPSWALPDTYPEYEETRGIGMAAWWTRSTSDDGDVWID